MCEWLEISKSGYYDWRSRPQSAAAKRHELLKIKVKALFDANNGEYGYRRVHAALVRGGEQVDDETVRGIMRELGLEPCQPKPRCRSLTEQDGQASPIPDLVNRDFSASKPGLKMVGISPTFRHRIRAHCPGRAVNARGAVRTRPLIR
jgi:putative transposase